MAHDQDLARPADEPVTPAVAAWADQATAVLQGNPAQQRWVRDNETSGDLSLRPLLEPDALRELGARCGVTSDASVGVKELVGRPVPRLSVVRVSGAS
jgi:hypothetical protein